MEGKYYERFQFLLLLTMSMIFASRNQCALVYADENRTTWVGSKYEIECTMCSACDNPCNTPSPPPPPPPPATNCPPPSSGGNDNSPPPPPDNANYSPPSPPPGAVAYPPPPPYYLTVAAPPPPNPIVPYFPYYYYIPPPPSSSSLPPFKKISLCWLIINLILNFYHFRFF